MNPTAIILAAVLASSPAGTRVVAQADQSPASAPTPPPSPTPTPLCPAPPAKPALEAKKPPPPVAPVGLQVAGWIAVALGAGAIGAGVAFSTAGSNQLSQAQSLPSAAEVYAGQHSGNESVGLGMGAYGLGSLLVIGGVSAVLVYFLHQPTVTPAAIPGTDAVGAKPGTITANGRALAISF
jgi:hypothetical protein